MDQLKLLMDYTKFHLAMYASLVTGLTIWMELKPKTDQGIEFWALGFTMTCFLIAGAAGESSQATFPTSQHIRSSERPISECGKRGVSIIPGHTLNTIRSGLV